MGHHGTRPETQPGAQGDCACLRYCQMSQRMTRGDLTSIVTPPRFTQGHCHETRRCGSCRWDAHIPAMTGPAHGVTSGARCAERPLLLPSGRWPPASARAWKAGHLQAAFCSLEMLCLQLGVNYERFALLLLLLDPNSYFFFNHLKSSL